MFKIYFKKFNIAEAFWNTYSMPFIIYWIQLEFIRLGQEFDLILGIIFSLIYINLTIGKVIGIKKKEKKDAQR